jgi:hypothetical protein
MPMKKYKPEQIVTLLQQVEAELTNGKSTTQACKEAKITAQNYYGWRKEFGVEGHFIVMGLKILRDGFPVRTRHRQSLRVKRRTAKNEARATSTAPIPPLRDGPTLRSRTAGSQDESRCRAIHKFNSKADPSLRPAPVPSRDCGTRRDGQEKARDCVRDDT